MIFHGDNIPSPKPLFKKDLLSKELKKGVRRIMLGSNYNGLYIDISPTGLTFNGYYEDGDERGVLYANVRYPVEIEWSEFDRIKLVCEQDAKPKRKSKPKKAGQAPYLIDDKPDKDYLDGLPIVTMNKKKYFLDPDRRERRLVDDPTKVYQY